MYDITRLAGKRCVPCEGGTTPLAPDAVTGYLTGLPGWQSDGARIFKTFTFRNYYQVMAFANALAFVAHRENHHPVLTVSFNQIEVAWTTHAIGGLSENDFICAAHTERLLTD